MKQEDFMSFRATVEELKQPRIYTLIAKENDGRTVIKGLRVKVCKAQRGRGVVPTIKYYDFVSKLIKDTEIKAFLKENIHSFETKELIKQGETESEFTYATQDELDGTVVPEEFVDSEDAVKVLRVVMSYYQNRNKGELGV